MEADVNIGFATIGQSPRVDVVPYLVKGLEGVEVFEGGVLDGLDRAGIDALYDPDDPVHMVTRLADGGSTKVSHRLVLPKMQEVVDGLNERGADVIVILCGADWSTISSSCLTLNLGGLFPHLLMGLAEGHRLGVIKPSAGQVERTARQYTEMGLDPVVTSAFPYDENALVAAEAAAEDLAGHDVDLVWMSCVGMDEEMRDKVTATTRKPVVLARSILRRVVRELAGAS